MAPGAADAGGVAAGGAGGGRPPSAARTPIVATTAKAAATTPALVSARRRRSAPARRAIGSNGGCSMPSRKRARSAASRLSRSGTRHLRSWSITIEALGERRAAPRQPGLHRARRDAERLRDLVDAQVGVVMQHDRLAV